MEQRTTPTYNKEFDRILKGVSRSFYLTLRMLPRQIRPQISTAYLIARACDTIVDTEAIEPEKRIKTLVAVRKRVFGNTGSEIDLLTGEFGKVENPGCTKSEAKLLLQINKIIALIETFEQSDKESIRKVIKNITTGQELDLLRFSKRSDEKVIALETDKELDEYTYYVAGCVGEFWTDICFNHIFINEKISYDSLIKYGIEYGKGLQLINVLRDIATDLKNSRCYIPVEMLKKYDLTPGELLIPDNEKKFRPLYNYYIQRAYNFLNSGREYIRIIPKKYIRLRLVTAWPLLIGIKTLNKLCQENVLNPYHKIKISRYSLWKTIILSIILYPVESAFLKLFKMNVNQ